MKRAIFLDRDGVLNAAIIKDGKPYPPATLDDLIIPNDALPALQQLKACGFLLIGATNQPDVARGKMLKQTVESINNKLLQTLPLDAIRVCYHDDKDNCLCRKPLPGLLTQAAQDFRIDLSHSFMIGDRWKDIAAGKKAGCKVIFIDHEYQEPLPNDADFVTTSLLFAVMWIKKIMFQEFDHENNSTIKN